MGLSRRQFFSRVAAGLTVFTLPKFLFANPLIKENRFVFVLLRGGMDGLSAVIPYSDPNYRKFRGALALPEPGGSEGSNKLSGDFALHPAFKNLATLYKDKDLVVIPAVASPYRERSHFDGQNVLEGGGIDPYEQSTGWLNRCLTAMSSQADVHGLAVGQAIPLVMQGSTSVENWSPSFLREPAEDTYDRLADMYRNDRVLSQSLQNHIETSSKLGYMGSSKSARRGAGNFVELAGSAGKLMANDDGAQVASLEMGGWDTHANQGTVTGRLANGFTTLDKGLGALKKALGSRWSQTTLVVMTEFGRTVKTNGTGGTDHGTASTAFVLGGDIKGGKILGGWPGLSKNNLYQGRDLRPTTDTRAILKRVLSHRFGLPTVTLTQSIFKNSESIQELNIEFS